MKAMNKAMKKDGAVEGAVLPDVNLVRFFWFVFFSQTWTMDLFFNNMTTSGRFLQKIPTFQHPSRCPLFRLSLFGRRPGLR